MKYKNKYKNININKNKSKDGITIVPLVITLVIIITLEAALLFSINNNKTILLSTKAAIMADMQTIEQELSVYISQKYIDTKGKIEQSDINASTKEEMLQILPFLENTKYENYITIKEGKIVINKFMPHRNWAIEVVGDN